MRAGALTAGSRTQPDHARTSTQGLVRSQSGQAVTEYVLTSGMLVLIGIALSGIVTPALKVFVEAVMWELRFLSP